MVLGFSAMLPVGLIGLASILVLVYSAEVVVSKMQGVAKYYGVSEVVIAMTIVSIGTSLPELSLHIVGSFDILLSDVNVLSYMLGQPLSFLLDSFGVVLTPEAVTSFQNTSATVLGSNIGSDVVQQTLVLGLVIVFSALLADRHSFNFSRKFLIRDYAPMMGTTLMTLILALNWQNIVNFLTGGAQLAAGGTLTRLDGLVLVGSFVAYIYYLYTTRKEELAEQGDGEASRRPRMDFAIGILAMFFVIGSAEIFLDVVEVLIAQTGLSGSMIGVASVGVVSAFPEMITAISGLRQGSEGISLGTLVGSNITNPLLAIGLGSTLSTYAVPGPLVLWDLPMETITAGVLLTYMFSKDAIGDFLGKWARMAGFEGLAERFEAMENRVISIAGAGLLVVLYFVYLYVRFRYFKYDFIGG
ncbi:MAG: hypothetical protein ABEK16_01000 [Candidatus Nanohalobium sp.]